MKIQRNGRINNMAYTVAPRAVLGERKDLPVGEHVVTIKIAKIQDSRFAPYKEISDMGFTKVEEISILLENDLGETKFDTIGQKLNKETITLEFYTWKMNNYSDAVNIPVGTTFGSIQEWANYLVGKRIKVVIEQKENSEYTRVVSVLRNDEEDNIPPVNAEGLPF